MEERNGLPGKEDVAWWDLLFRALARTVGYRNKVDDAEAKRLAEEVT